jgi:AraC-like DNA-binding protein
MNRALALLRLTDKTIAEIAEECGFSDASYFTKSFKNIYSVTPKDYRAKFDGEFI